MFEIQDKPADPREAFDKLEQLRSESDFSQAELCRKADLNQSTYTRLIQEADRTPHRRTVRKLWRAWGELCQPASAA